MRNISVSRSLIRITQTYVISNDFTEIVFTPAFRPKIQKHACLTHYRPAMPFGNRKLYFRGSFQFTIVTIQKILPLWKPEI